MRKRILAALLSAAVCLSLLPTAAFAAGMQSGTIDLKVNESKVAFAGKEWWVIGYNGQGVYSTANDNHATLLSVRDTDGFGTSTFRVRRTNQSSGYTKYTSVLGEHYYRNNPEGMSNWTTPNEYAGSHLQQRMVSIANGFPAKEQNVITARTLTGGGTYQNPSADGIAGQGISNQKLWALSKAEWETINNETVRGYGQLYWLRSPSETYGHGAHIGAYYDTLNGAVGSSNNDQYIRPAFSLNLSFFL